MPTCPLYPQFLVESCLNKLAATGQKVPALMLPNGKHLGPRK